MSSSKPQRLILRNHAVNILTGEVANIVDHCVNPPGISWRPSGIHEHFGFGRCKDRLEVRSGPVKIPRIPNVSDFFRFQTIWLKILGTT